MTQPVLLIPSGSRSWRHLADLQDFCATLSTFVQEDVGCWTIAADDWAAVVEQTASIEKLELVDHHGERIIDSPRAMASAPFAYKDDGRPDWGSMWKGFCELALYGGPPHRGPEAALEVPQAGTGAIVENEMVEELIRGIDETTGLRATPAPGGWLRVECDSKRMAAWLCATIILENVDARMEGTYLFVPGDQGFELKDEVKSVITVVAKSNHYWQEHIANEGRETQARAEARSLLQGENLVELRKAG